VTTPPDDRFYDAGWASDWTDLKRYSPMGRHTRRWIQRLLGQIPTPKHIADIGCGEGSLLAEVASHYPSAELLGCDFSTVSVEACRRRLPDGTFVVHDVHDPANPFGRVVDVAINSEVIEHVEDDRAAVANMASWCRHLILTVPSGELDDMSRQMGHLRHYDERSLTHVVEAAGLEVVECRTWGFPLAHPWYSRMRNRAGYSTVIGRYSTRKRLLTHALYGAFFLNDLFRGGNKLFLLARNPGLAGAVGDQPG
jgi:SAM-dependent methyltransferase